jgi:hypothetical protein
MGMKRSWDFAKANLGKGGFLAKFWLTCLETTRKQYAMIARELDQRTAANKGEFRLTGGARHL